MAQSVVHPTSAQVMISWSVSSSPASGSVLTAQSLEPVSDSVSPSLSDPPPFRLSFPVSKINKCLKKKLKKKKSGTKRGSWVVQWVKCPALDFGSGHDLTVCGSSPTSDSALSVLGILSFLSLCPSPFSL